MKFIPAGVSKSTGKPYAAFWSCPNRCPKNNQNAMRHQEKDKREPFVEAQKRKDEMIAKAQGRKEESMRVLNSKSGAAEITVSLIAKGFCQPKDVEATFAKYCLYIYEFEPVEKTPYDNVIEYDEEVYLDELPF